jgi:hypothetical protein
VVQTSVKAASSLADEIRLRSSSPDGNTLAVAVNRSKLRLFGWLGFPRSLLRQIQD